MSLQEYISLPGISIGTALEKIDGNKKGFLIITDENNKLLGTITDGDIRRAFIKGKTIESSIAGIYKNSCRSVTVQCKIEDTIDIFKDEAIKFLPVVDTEQVLVNILTRKQLHALLLLDKQVDWSYDFTELDEHIVDYEIFRRPWGFYKTTVMNDYFQSKVISVAPNGELSLQSHNRREEHWIIAHGTGVVQLGDSIVPVTRGSTLFIPKGCRHRLKNCGDETLILIEVQIGDYFGEDDIIRYEDKYGRK